MKNIRSLSACWFLFLLSSPGLFSQDFSSIDSDLQQLENLIANTLSSTQEHMS